MTTLKMINPEAFGICDRHEGGLVVVETLLDEGFCVAEPTRWRVGEYTYRIVYSQTGVPGISSFLPNTGEGLGMDYWRNPDGHRNYGAEGKMREKEKAAKVDIERMETISMENSTLGARLAPEYYWVTGSYPSIEGEEIQFSTQVQIERLPYCGEVKVAPFADRSKSNVAALYGEQPIKIWLHAIRRGVAVAFTSDRTHGEYFGEVRRVAPDSVPVKV